MHTDLKVGRYWGEMGVDFWNAADWKKQQDEFEVSLICSRGNFFGILAWFKKWYSMSHYCLIISLVYLHITNQR